jgi:hypothetical protein
MDVEWMSEGALDGLEKLEGFFDSLSGVPFEGV